MFLSARPVRAATYARRWHLLMSEFLSARPVRAATFSRWFAMLPYPLVSIRATRAGRDFVCLGLPAFSAVSIRATRAGRDPDITYFGAYLLCFYPRDPCGPRHERRDSGQCRRSFYPRDPCGPRRLRWPRPTRDPACFYPRDPCGPRHEEGRYCLNDLQFLSARPVRAATRCGNTHYPGMFPFLSARPVRAATSCGCGFDTVDAVSIRATRAGRDISAESTWRSALGFYPRDPCGPRPGCTRTGTHTQTRFYPRDPCGPRPTMSPRSLPNGLFLSARPVRAATSGLTRLEHPARVSIRATRAGRDIFTAPTARCEGVFLSARPVRAATAALQRDRHADHVSIRATRAGRDISRRA